MSFLTKTWLDTEELSPPPSAVSEVRVMNFSELRTAVDQNDRKWLTNLTSDLYQGIGFILRGAAPRSLREKMLRIAHEYNSTKDVEFYKMLDETPNFHRIIDKDITQKYSLYAIKHSFYLYNWNLKTKVELEFKEAVYEHWRYVKFLAGNQMRQYEDNLPSDGQIDRLQIVNYPQGGGELREHVDPQKNQRIVSGLIMSKIGEDFTSGGFYFKTKTGTKINIEDRLEIGDSVMFYGSIPHGVDPIDSHLPLNWGLDVGRWFIGMFVNDSDHIQGRVTARDSSGSLRPNTTTRG